MHQTEMPLKTVEIGDERQVRQEIRKLIEDNRDTAGAIIRVLQGAQGICGYLPAPVMRIVSEELKVPLIEVYGIISFYHFFSTVPKGRHVIQVCMGTSCYVKGAEKLLKGLKKEWKLTPRGITDDGRFSLESVYCVGACGLSPVVAIDSQVHGKVKPSQVNDILGLYE